jgi:hypothetical protein
VVSVYWADDYERSEEEVLGKVRMGGAAGCPIRGEARQDGEFLAGRDVDVFVFAF